MKQIPDESIDLICTSPPFALVRKKEYGNVDATEYIEWFEPFAKEFYRILKPKGSYASRMMDVSRYYMILLQREYINAIKQDKTNIIKILDKQARRLFAKKELEMPEKEIAEIELEEEMLSELALDEE